MFVSFLLAVPVRSERWSGRRGAGGAPGERSELRGHRQRIAVSAALTLSHWTLSFASSTFYGNMALRYPIACRNHTAGLSMPPIGR